MQSYLPTVVATKYLALMFYVNKWVALCQEKNIEEFEGLRYAIFVGGGSIGLSTICAGWDQEQFRNNIVAIDKRDPKFFVINNGNSHKPEVVEGAFNGTDFDEKDAGLRIIENDIEIRELASKIFDELVAFMDKKLSMPFLKLREQCRKLGGHAADGPAFTPVYQNIMDNVKERVSSEVVRKAREIENSRRRLQATSGYSEIEGEAPQRVNGHSEIDIVGLVVKAFTGKFYDYFVNGQ